MRKRSKRYRAMLDKIGDPKTPRAWDEAIELVKSVAGRKFSESIDLVIRLNIDTRKADQQVRGSFSLPHGTGKTVRVIAFTDDTDRMQACLDAGADKAGGEELVTAVQDGFLDFDVAIATPKMMRLVGRLGRVLGPRGLMPAPKSGTVTEDIVTAVSEFRAGKIEYRADSAGNVHVRVGTIDFDKERLVENAQAMFRHLTDHRPAAVKGDFIAGVSLSSTMGPGIRIAV